MTDKLISLDEIRAARARMGSTVIVTPSVHSTSFSRMTGRDVWFKAENLQRTGSFKIRGAMNVLSQLDPEERSAGVVAASAGNHAQGVALAAQSTGVRATVFMPEAAPLPKVSATREYGAEVRLTGTSLEDAVVAARAYAGETGARFIHPYDDAAIVTGQGTPHSSLWCKPESRLFPALDSGVRRNDNLTPMPLDLDPRVWATAR